MKKAFLFTLLAIISINQNCFAIPEICGNGIDDDGVGGDQSCPEPDKDNDGFQSIANGGNDCDDTDYKMYPGVITASGCPSGQTRKCQTNGTFTACSSDVVCEASAGSTCKYIDCGSGSDTTGNGSYNSPWKSFKQIGYHENTNPSGWYRLQAGDVVYLKGTGTCSDWYNPGSGYPNVVLYMTLSGTADKPITIKRYPGSTAVIDPPFTQSTQGHVIRADGSKYLHVEDLEITGSYAAVLYFSDVHYNEISRVKCHDTQGTTYDNIACLNASGDLVSNYFHHNEFYNVYDPVRPGEDNVSTVVLFGGYNNRVEYNRLYYTNSPAYSGTVKGKCIKYKHPGTSGTFTLKGNQMWNCYKEGVENSANGIRMSNNLLVNPSDYSGAAGYFCGDIGAGTSYCKEGIVENNTFVNFRPVSYREAMNANLGTTIVRNNVMIDNASSYTSENGFYRIERYGSDSDYNRFLSLPALNSNNNCFYNPNTSLKFDLFADSLGGPAGSMNTFSQWQSLGFDSSTQVVNPNLNSNFIATTSPCSGYGWRTNSSPGAVSRPNAPTGVSGTVN